MVGSTVISRVISSWQTCKRNTIKSASGVCVGLPLYGNLLTVFSSSPKWKMCTESIMGYMMIICEWQRQDAIDQVIRGVKQKPGMVGTLLNLTFRRLSQEACHKFQKSLCCIAKVQLKEKEKERENGKSLCREEHMRLKRTETLLRRESRPRNCDLSYPSYTLRRNQVRLTPLPAKVKGQWPAFSMVLTARQASVSGFLSQSVNESYHSPGGKAGLCWSLFLVFSRKHTQRQ